MVTYPSSHMPQHPSWTHGWNVDGYIRNTWLLTSSETISLPPGVLPDRSHEESGLETAVAAMLTRGWSDIPMPASLRAAARTPSLERG